METATRDAGGRFMPGCSGNPAGKKPGTLNHTTRLKLWLDDPEADSRQVALALRAKAIEGNVPAVRIWLDPFDPKPRSRPITLELAEDATFTERFNALLAAIGAGAVTPEEGLQLTRILDTFSKIAERQDAAERIQAEADARHEAEIANQREEFRQREEAYLERIAAAEAKAAAAQTANQDRHAGETGHPEAVRPDGAPATVDPCLRGADIQGVRDGVASDAPAEPHPPRDPSAYARPCIETTEGADPLHPASICRDWHGKTRYGERGRPAERDGVPLARAPRRRLPSFGGTWMGA